MPKILDLTGQRFGKLTVILKCMEKDRRGNVMWKCSCDCGSVTSVSTAKLRYGHTQSCGCFQKEAVKASNTTHGLSQHPLYLIWYAMIARCHSEDNPDYGNYGARGIFVCERWRGDIEAFNEDMGPRPSRDYTVERRDNDQGYSKENCYWATRVEQANNRRTNLLVEFKGEKKSLKAWCRLLNLNYQHIYRRVNKGMSFDAVVSELIPGNLVEIDRNTSMMQNNNAIVVSYPNQIGDCGRYELRDQRTYFSKFEGGSSYFFELALNTVLTHDLPQYCEWCNEAFDVHYVQQFEENTTNLEVYNDDRRNFNRRCFDLYRFAKSSLSSIDPELGFSSITRIATNHKFDSSSFLVR